MLGCTMAFTESDKPVEIARFVDRSQAELALSALRASGIEAHLDQTFTSSLHHLLTPVGIRLFVRASDAQSATIALQSQDDAAGTN